MRENKKISKSKTEKFVDTLQLPKDILHGDMRITLIGNREAWVENYKGILEYSDTCIILQGRNSRVQFMGKHLMITYYTNEDMKLTGRITGINYL